VRKIVMSKVYIIKGDPTPLMRARISGKRMYDPQKNLKLIASIDIVSQHDDAPLMEGPLHLDITFFMEPAKSISLKRRNALYGQTHIFKPDLDNLIKFARRCL
jgi:Holliday junction resolvase RusA-like endonuclease